MSGPLAILDYAAPARRPPRTFLGRCWRAIVFLITFTVVAVFLTLRAVVLIAGVALVFAGTLLLVVGGKRGAAEKLAQWREHTIDLLRLWGGDIARPIRQWRTRRAPATQ